MGHDLALVILSGTGAPAAISSRYVGCGIVQRDSLPELKWSLRINTASSQSSNKFDDADDADADADADADDDDDDDDDDINVFHVCL